MNTNKVLVIIVTYNAMKWASRCFESLINSEYHVDVYIVDNGSTDGTQDFIKHNYPHFKFLQSSNNLGFGAANNYGFEYAIANNYDYIYLLNQDAWISEETIQKLISASQNNNDYGILSPVQYSGDSINLDRGFERIYGSAFDGKSNSEITNVPFVMAAHWFIPIDVLKLVGGFSPSFFHYGEDLNYIDRVKYHGYCIGIVNTAKGVHDRYDRPETSEKQFYLKDVLNLARLSNPNYSFTLNILRASFYAFAYSIKTLCIKPIYGILGYFRRAKEIRTNYKISKKEFAFLNQKAFPM